MQLMHKLLLLSLLPLVLGSAVFIIFFFTSTHNDYAIMLALLGGIAILTVCAMVLFNRFTIRPLYHIAAVQRKIAQGDFGARALVKSRDEWKGLADSLNQMAQNLETMTMRAHESEAKLATVLRTAPVAITLLSSEGKVLDTNQAGREMFGYNQNEILGLHTESLNADPEEASRVKTYFQTELKTKNVASLETRMRRKDGSKFLGLVTSALLQPGNPFGEQVVVGIDITQQKEAEEKLRKSEEMYRRLTDNMSDIVSELDSQGRYIYAGPAQKKLFGRDPNSLMGVSVLDNVHPDDRIRVMSRMQDGIRTGKDQEVEYRLQHQDGHYIWIRSSGRFLFDEKGNYTGMIVCTSDISERKRAEELLSESENRFRSIVDQSPFAIIVFSPSGDVIHANETHLRLSGDTQETVVKYNIFRDPQTEAVGLQPLLRRAFSGEQLTVPPFELDLQKTLGVGRRKILQGELYPIRDAKGNVFSVILVQEDVTERITAEKALRESEEKFRTIFEIAPFSIRISDLDGNTIDANPAFCEAAGVPKDKVVNSNQYELFTLENPEHSALAYEKLLRDGVLQNEELLTTRNVDGKKRHTLYSAKLVQIKGKTCILSTTVDITELRKAEEAKRELENKYLSYFHTLPDASLVTRDSDGMIIETNNAFSKVFGYTSEDISGKTTLDIGLWVDLSAWEQWAKSLHELSTGNQCEMHARRKDGSVAVVLLSSRKWVTNEETYSLTVCKDISDRKREEEELRRLRNYLTNIIQSMPSVLIGVDQNGKVTQWNRRTESDTKLLSSEAIGRRLEEVFPRISDQMSEIFRSIKDRNSRHVARRSYSEAGELHYEDMTIFPLIANGVEGAVIRLDDITEKVRMEEMMVQSEKMLSIGGLAAGMAHEINNPLGGMMQTASVMRDRLLGDLPANRTVADRCGISLNALHAYAETRGIPQMLDTIRDSGLRAAGIVQNMLSFSRKADSTRTSADLPSLINETLELAGTDYNLKKNYDFRKIEIIRQYAEDLPPVPCEPQKIQQVLLNLFRNSAEAMQDALLQNVMPSPPRIIVRTVRDGGMARIEIEDNGPGMAEEIRKRIFEPFFTTKAVGQGTGLGLSVSYFIIVENHGGQISVESELGKGTRFIIRLFLGEK